MPGVPDEIIFLCEPFFTSTAHEQSVLMVHEVCHMTGRGHPANPCMDNAQLENLSVLRIFLRLAADGAGGCTPERVAFICLNDPCPFSHFAAAVGGAVERGITWPMCAKEPGSSTSGGTPIDCSWDPYLKTFKCLSKGQGSKGDP
jgi:hypothetical protein